MVFGLTEECLSVGKDHLLKILPPVFIELRQELLHLSFGAVRLHANESR